MRRWSVFTVSSGCSISLVSISACLCTKCLLSFTFGQTPRTWVGAPFSTVRSLRACRTPVRQRCLSTPGNGWLFGWGFASSGHLSEVAQWLSFATNHGCAFPSQRECPLVSSPHHLGSGVLALDGVHLHPPAFTVPSGLRHRPNRLPVSPSPAPPSRVVYTHDRLSVFETTVTGSIGFFATSATHRGSIYFSPFRGQQARTRFSRSGTAFGLTRSLRWLSSAYYREAPGIHGDGTHSCDSPLG